MTAAFYTLGCKVNQYETQALERLFTQRGHTLVPFDGEADVYALHGVVQSSYRPALPIGPLHQLTEEFCARAAGLDNLCPHFHLSMQSGCDETLKRMNRKYSAARFYESVALLGVPGRLE